MNRSGSNHSRNPLFLFGGLVILGIAAALLLFGGEVFNNTGRSESILEQVPVLSAPDRDTAVTSPREPLAAGDTAVDFTLNDLDGTAISLSDFRGQPVIVNFWATWCAPCRIEMPELQAAYEAYQDDGLVILALDQDETAEQVRAFFYDEMNLTFTPLLDEGGQISQLYGVFNFPATFFIDGRGTITTVHRGPMTQAQIEGYLADILATEG